MIRPAQLSDAAQISEIYNYYIRHTIITFEEEPVTPEVIAGRLEAITSQLPWLVYEEAGIVVGYAYASQWKVRSAYRHTAEITVYLRPGSGGRGIGTQLYAVLIGMLRERRFHAVIGGVAMPNPASLALHEKLGFRKVAHFIDVGFKFDQWIDVTYWELLL